MIHRFWESLSPICSGAASFWSLYSSLCAQQVLIARSMAAVNVHIAQESGHFCSGAARCAVAFALQLHLATPQAVVEMHGAVGGPHRSFGGKGRDGGRRGSLWVKLYIVMSSPVTSARCRPRRRHRTTRRNSDRTPSDSARVNDAVRAWHETMCAIAVRPMHETPSQERIMHVDTQGEQYCRCTYSNDWLASGGEHR